MIIPPQVTTIESQARQPDAIAPELCAAISAWLQGIDKSQVQIGNTL
jgi:hypothetical protein